MKAGDIVWVKFPYEDGIADKLHPALVLDVLAKGRAVVAYGTSKHVDRVCPPANEVTIADPEDMVACGLRIPTRFVLSIRATLVVREKYRSGSLPAHKYKQLYRAAVTCGLIDA